MLLHMRELRPFNEKIRFTIRCFWISVLGIPRGEYIEKSTFEGSLDTQSGGLEL